MLQGLQHQEGIGQHHQRHMAMQPFPGAPLKVVQATFPLGIFVELLNRPAQMGQFYQARRGRLGRQRAEEPPRLTVLAGQGPLPEQPALRSGPTASMGRTVTRRAGSRMDPQRHDLFAQDPAAALAPLHDLPGAPPAGLLVSAWAVWRGAGRGFLG